MGVTQFTRIETSVIAPGEMGQTTDDETGPVANLGKSSSETLRFLTWWRFLGYGPRAEKFLEKLDMRDPDKESFDHS